MCIHLVVHVAWVSMHFAYRGPSEGGGGGPANKSLPAHESLGQVVVTGWLKHQDTLLFNHNIGWYAGFTLIPEFHYLAGAKYELNTL